MKTIVLLTFLCLASSVWGQRHTILDQEDNTPISYATISFGNGNGLFADEDGKFLFYQKWYSDIDSLYISALGYKEKALATQKLPKTILLEKDVSELKEVFLVSEKKRKYKTKKISSEIHDDYFKCWLPTVESEISVYFPKPYEKDTKIATVYLPVKMEESNRRSGQKQRFSTLFKMQFYSKGKDGYPDKRLPYENIIFEITDEDKANFELDIEEYGVYMPKEGLFISIQVLGYTDKNGKLEQTKKYSEIETRKGIVKVPTTFRPLLPFTDKQEGYQTYTRRIFFKNRTWQRFDPNYSKNNNLLKIGHTNYGMGVKYYLYEED
ncbi:hypothetical protein [Aquimarina brevivitae]|uniref:Carboxypeptidase-like protein n=1 Tax=Aquimarina brevivitae TaxID=323412 RepID=A0A4Q7P3D5_9FLAO|nr:hypothetical protein [Aquimarina brevivitae]RZS93888.1 hypothetical protein EV197_2469 [Aquimarina brevivitae]